MSDLIRAAEELEDGVGPVRADPASGGLAVLLRCIYEWTEADVGESIEAASDMHRAAEEFARRLLTTQTDGGTQ